MHGDDDVRFEQADHLGCLDGGEAAAAADRNEGYMHRADSFYFGLGGYPVYIAQMQNVDYRCNRKGTWYYAVLRPSSWYGRGLNTGDEHASDFKFAGAVDEVGITFHS